LIREKKLFQMRTVFAPLTFSPEESEQIAEQGFEKRDRQGVLQSSLSKKTWNQEQG
jgi:hypothetical protein